MEIQSINLGDMQTWRKRQLELMTVAHDGITIHGDPDKKRDHDYFIAWSRLTNAGDTLAWVFHLSQKNWVTGEILCRFIEEVSQYRDIDIYNLG